MRPTLVRGGILLAVTIGLSVWAAELTGTRPAHERRTGSVVPTRTQPVPAVVPEDETEVPRVAAAPAPPPDIAPPPVAEPVTEPLTDEGLADDERSRTHDGLTVRQAREREALVSAARKREADNLAQHEKNIAQWEAEGRDPERARPIEDDITQLLIDANLDHMLVDISCRETMCMLEVDMSGSHSAIGALHSTPGLVEALGGDAMSSGFKDDAVNQQRTFMLLGPTRVKR